jgi:hypothetical protein
VRLRAWLRLAVVAILALTCRAGSVPAERDGGKERRAVVEDWSVSARVDKDRYSPGEPILVLVSARARRSARRPALAPGEPFPPVLEVRKNGGPLERVPLPGLEGGALPRETPFVPGGDAVEGGFDLEPVVQPGTGTYEVVLELRDRSRSAPFKFAVERAPPVASATACMNATGVGARSFARVEALASSPRALLTRPAFRARQTLDLGTVPRAAAIRVSVQPEETADGRTWVVLLAGRSLLRTFADAEPRVYAFGPVEAPEGVLELVAALGGALVDPSPPPPLPVESDGRIHVPDEEPWPELHVLLASRPTSGPSRLFGVALAPSVASAPVTATCDLPRRFLAGAAVPLSPTSRFAFAAVPGDKGAGIELLAFAWNASGFGPQVRLARSSGALLALDAVALESGGARAAVLVVERREKEKDDALFVREARVDPTGVVQELPPRLVASGELIKTLSNVRLRIVGPRGVHVLATHTKLRQSVLIEEGADEPWPVKVNGGAPWDLEVLPNGGLVAISLDPERGVVTEPIEAPALGR